MNPLPRRMILAALASALLVTACGPTIDDSTYEQIAAGMSLDQVQGILGSDGEKETAGGVQISAAGVMSSTSSETLSEQVYVWRHVGVNTPEIVVKFKDGKVVSKFKRNF
jgi:hypothetical protein